MQISETAKNSGRELIDRLKATRDAVRLQLHLLSLEARKSLHEVESNLNELELELERGSAGFAEAIPLKVKEIGQALVALVREADGSLELATPVESLMKHAPATCAPGDSLDAAARIMWENDCGSVPVVDAEHRLVGVLTDRDICMASYTRGQPLWAMSVISTMATPAVSASPTDSLGHVARLMADNRVRRVPIVDNQKLVGIVALADIARHVRRNAAYSLPACLALAHTLGDISDDTRQGRLAAE